MTEYFNLREPQSRAFLYKFGCHSEHEVRGISYNYWQLQKKKKFFIFFLHVKNFYYFCSVLDT